MICLLIFFIGLIASLVVALVGSCVTLVVVTISLILISKLPIGVEIDSFPKAIISAFVFGILNTFIKPILMFFSAPINFITFDLFTIVINAIIFSLAAMLVPGFTLKCGFRSALLGGFLLGIIQSLILHLLPFSMG